MSSFTENVMKRAGLEPTQQPKRRGLTPRDFEIHTELTRPMILDTPAVRHIRREGFFQPEIQEAQRRRGLPGDEIRAAPEPSFLERVRRRLPQPIQDFTQDARRFLIGDPQQRQQIESARERGVDVPITADIRAGGLFPFLGRTDTEKIDISKNSLIRSGATTEQAEEIAKTEVFARGGIPGTPAYEEWQKMREKLPGELKRSVTMSRTGQFAGASLDVLSFVPMGSVLKAPTTAVQGPLKAAKNKNAASKVLREAGFAEDLIPRYAQLFAKTTDDSEITRLLKSMEGSMAPARTPPGSAQVTPVDLPTQALPTSSTKDFPVSIYKINKTGTDATRAGRKLAQQNIVANRIMRDGSKKPAIRKSGVYAPKEFELHGFGEVDGIAGGQSFNIFDTFLSLDNIPITQIAKHGDLGPFTKLGWQTLESTARVKEFGPRQATKISNIAKKYNVPINETTGIQSKLYGFGLRNADIQSKGARQAIIDVLKKADISEDAINESLRPGFLRRVRGKESRLVEAVKGGIPENIQQMGNEIRKHYDELREFANKTRLSLGKSEIPFRKNYTEAIQSTNFWNRVRNQPRTEIVDNFDFVIPNARKNPHALQRKAGARDLEWNLWNSLPRYHEAVANDVFMSPMIEQVKVGSEVIRGRGLIKESNLINRHIRENLVGNPSWLDNMFGITPDSRKRAFIDSINRARTTSALAFNLVWSTFVQPASGILANARATAGGKPVLGLAYGPLNMAKGSLKWFTSSARRAQVMKLPTPRTKAAGQSIGSTGAGDLHALGGKIMETKLDTLNDYLKLYADAMEYNLTGISASAGYEMAGRLGIRGRQADFIADWLAGASQSRYNREARTLVQNSTLVRTNFPFQTYLFEFYRFNKTLAGMPGGMPLEKTERFNQAVMMLTGMYLYDKFYLEPVTGRRLFRPSVFVPAVGEQVEQMLQYGAGSVGVTEDTPILGSALNMDDRRRFGGQPPASALASDAASFVRGVDAYVRHGNFDPLRRELTKWGMGFSGIGGATTLNRFIDGMKASTDGFMTDRSNQRMFRVEGIDKYISPLLGPYSTRAGIEFFREGGSIVAQDARKELRRIRELEPDEAAEEFDLIAARNPAVAKQMNILQENEEFPILEDLRGTGVANGMRAQLVMEKMEELDPQEREETYQRLMEYGRTWGDGAIIITDEVDRQIGDIMERRRKAANGNDPFEHGETMDDKSFIEALGLWARGVGADPKRAFEILFSDEDFRSIRRVDNGAIIVERMELRESEAIKRERGAKKDMFLDHVVPLQLGGSNRDDNLVLLSRAEWEASTPIENLLGDHLRAGNIKGSEARKLIKQFKEGEMSAREIIETHPPFSGDTLSRFSPEFLRAYEERGTQGAVDYLFDILDGSVLRPDPDPEPVQQAPRAPQGEDDFTQRILERVR